MDHNVLEELFLDGATGRDEDKEFVPVRPEPDTAESSAGSGHTRVGNTIHARGVGCGTISYLLHWDPASYAANCKVHEDCYVTAALSTVEEHELETWLAKGPMFFTAKDHIMAKPMGSYNRRRI